MTTVALVGLVDARGRVLLQERDDKAPVDPDRWSLVGGGAEAGETALDAARRELREETGLEVAQLTPLGVHTLPCEVHGEDDFHLFTAATEVTDNQVECHEGRQIVFVARSEIAGLDLAPVTARLLPLVLASHVALEADDPPVAVLERVSLRGARFVETDLSGAVMRGVAAAGLDIDDPFLLGKGRGTLVVSGVDVVPYVDAELDRRFPGRALRRATDPEGLRAAWVAVETAWAGAMAHAATLPAGAVDVAVDNEWSFAQTVRHLVMATDIWLRGAVLGIDEPLHPLGQPHGDYELDGYDVSGFVTGVPAYADVLDARADRVGQVRAFLAGVTAGDLDGTRPHPWGPHHQVTVRSCLHTVLNEEWEHLRYALRDLATVEERLGSVRPPPR